MKKLCDLHTHSIYSDGTYTPTELILEAEKIGLSAIALCDHNTVDGLLEFLSAASSKEVTAVSGCEFSVDYNGKELHLLGLFIPPERFDEVSSLMADVNKRKEESNIALIESLRRAGFDLSFDEIKASTPNGKFNRAHVAAVMTKKGYTASIKEAFATHLSKDGGHYREPERLTVFETIDFIIKIGALPVLAHPFLNLDYGELCTFLPLAVERGLVGMECYYSKFDEETTALSLKLCKEYGLTVSGGSDFHGENKPDISLGSGRGNLAIPISCYENLIKRLG